VPNPDDGSDDDRQAFMAQMSTQVAHVLDDPGSLWREHGVLSQPAMVFVNADGTTELRTGSLGPEDLLERAKSMAAA